MAKPKPQVGDTATSTADDGLVVGTVVKANGSTARVQWPNGRVEPVPLTDPTVTYTRR